MSDDIILTSDTDNADQESKTKMSVTFRHKERIPYPGLSHSPNPNCNTKPQPFCYKPLLTIACTALPNVYHTNAPTNILPPYAIASVIVQTTNVSVKSSGMKSGEQNGLFKRKLLRRVQPLYN